MSRFEPGMVVVVIAMLLFYLRLIQLRGRRKREARDEALEMMRTHNKGKNKGKDITSRQKPLYVIRSWFMVAGGAVLMLAGLALRQSLSWLPSSLLPIQPYWWVVATIGVLIFIFSFK